MLYETKRVYSNADTYYEKLSEIIRGLANRHCTSTSEKDQKVQSVKSRHQFLRFFLEKSYQYRDFSAWTGLK